MKTIETKTIMSRGRAYTLWGRSATLSDARREASAGRTQGEPTAFARKGENCGEIYVAA